MVELVGGGRPGLTEDLHVRAAALSISEHA